MTANLDGETSLKTKYASKVTKDVKTVEEISQFLGCVECENPNPKLDSFLGRIFRFNVANKTSQQHQHKNGPNHPEKDQITLGSATFLTRDTNVQLKPNNDNIT